MTFDIDITIVVCFLLLTLAVGIGYGRQVRTIKDYALGGSNFSTGIIVATLVATWVSGSGFLTTLSQTYMYGFNYLIASFGLIISSFIMIYFIVPRMEEFLGVISIAEAMGNLYGRNVRIITSIGGFIAAAGLVAVQFKVLGSIFNYFLGVSQIYAVLLAAIITLLYSALGGIRSVTFTDLIQLITFGVVIPFLGFIIWKELDNPYSVYDIPENSLFDYKYTFKNHYLDVITLMMYFSIPAIYYIFY